MKTKKQKFVEKDYSESLSIMKLIKTFEFFSEITRYIDEDSVLLKWHQMRLKEKMKVGLKLIHKCKENTAQIKELMAKPAYLSEETIKECDRQIEAKIKVANKINADIVAVQSNSSYLNADQVTFLDLLVDLEYVAYYI